MIGRLVRSLHPEPIRWAKIDHSGGSRDVICMQRAEAVPANADAPVISPAIFPGRRRYSTGEPEPELELELELELGTTARLLTATRRHCDTATLRHCDIATLRHCDHPPPMRATNLPTPPSKFLFSNSHGNPKVLACHVMLAMRKA